MNAEQYNYVFGSNKSETTNMKKAKSIIQHYYDNEETRPLTETVLDRLEDYQHLIEQRERNKSEALKQRIADYRNEIQEMAQQLKESQLEGVFERVRVSQDTQIEELEKANQELNFFLGMENPLLVKNPQVLEDIQKVESGDLKYIEFLRKIYKISDDIPEMEATEILLDKLRQSLGLGKNKINPLKANRQSSYIGKFTQSQNKKDWFRFIL